MLSGEVEEANSLLPDFFGFLFYSMMPESSKSFSFFNRDGIMVEAWCPWGWICWINLLCAFKLSFFWLNPFSPTDLLLSLSMTTPLPACAPIPNLGTPPIELDPPGSSVFLARLPFIWAPWPYPRIVLYCGILSFYFLAICITDYFLLSNIFDLWVIGNV